MILRGIIVKKVFDNHPYELGFLYTSLLYGYADFITHNAHNDINPCDNPKMKIFTNLVEEFYSWIFVNNKSSFKKLNSREQRQIKQLYDAYALSHNYRISRYICEIPFKYKDKDNLPIYKNEDEFFHSSVTMKYFIAFSKLENLLNEKNKIKNKKDK